LEVSKYGEKLKKKLIKSIATKKGKEFQLILAHLYPR
jgi:hypothetical protein